MAASRDRRAALTAQTTLNGIDFVEVVDAAQTHLRLHFINAQPDAAALTAAVTGATITGGDTIPSVAVQPIAAASWGAAAGRPTLDLFVASPGDFSSYTLALTTSAPILDRFFDHAAFSFKAGCPSTLDCESEAAACPPPSSNVPPIDYLAKDFDSFRQALTDFSTLRYPDWQERSEADFGVMFLEALSSLADDLSYLQDRIAGEAWIETASERRSLVRLARMVDYEPRVAVAARAQLFLEVSGAATMLVPAGLLVSALAPDGSYVDFETGTDLQDTALYLADASWNRMEPHFWDDEQRCLVRGATSMWIERPAHALTAGQWLLIDTTADPPADPPIRQIVRLTVVDDSVTDLLYGTPLTRVEWGSDDALSADHDLTRTVVSANLVPATHGRRSVDQFVIAAAPSAGVSGPPAAVVRTGANGTPQLLHTLLQAPLAWLDTQGADAAQPEIRVVDTSGTTPSVWSWKRTLLDAVEFEDAFTLDPASYRVSDGYALEAEYDGADGVTIRFGDGVFGSMPAEGATFEVVYRSGGGARGNVAADAIARIDRANPAAAGIVAVSNPLPATGGRDQETDDQVRAMAPQRFRATQFRAVRAEDYDRAAMTLPWVQRAGTRFRYTGSWLSVFTAVDPKGTDLVSDDNLVDLANLVDRYRMAGYEAHPLAPRFASLDLRVALCVRSDAFSAYVQQGVLAALDTAVHGDGTHGFFHPDRFTFGAPLERSALEAAIQEVPGVVGVTDVRYRRRGYTNGFVPMPDAVNVAPDEIVRVDNDPNRPERGSLQIDTRGGK